jgi:hypothetical protein
MPVQLATSVTVQLGASKRLRRRRFFLPLVDDCFLSGYSNDFFLLALTLDGGYRLIPALVKVVPLLTGISTHPLAEKWFPFTPAFI